MIMKKPLVIITGPTAVGKSELAIHMAKRINGEIISADSIQVYKYMDIGSAKLKKEEMQGIPHYLIDELFPDEEFNVVKFKEYALSYMDQIYSKNKIPIIVGGTGFYIQALLYDINFTDTKNDTSYRQELMDLYEKKGAMHLHNLLREADEKSASQIHHNNVKRVIRALEYYKLTGDKISEHNSQQRENTSPYNFAYFVLNRNRETLYNSINLRIDKMLESGLIDEVKKLKEMNYTKDLISMQGLGYKEILMYLEGELSLEDALFILKRDTRHFAKRQLTWFRREKEVIWVDDDFHQDKFRMLEYMIQVLKNKEIIG
jgi:tRNA dimethylallyltransferase